MSNCKRLILFAVIASLLLLPACSEGRYRDGTYQAELPEFSESGWKDIMEITIEKGKLTKIDWDAIYVDESIPIRKKQYSKSGLYGMLTVGAVGEWYDQATAAEQFVLENGIDMLESTKMDIPTPSQAVRSMWMPSTSFFENALSKPKSSGARTFLRPASAKSAR